MLKTLVKMFAKNFCSNFCLKLMSTTYAQNLDSPFCSQLWINVLITQFIHQFMILIFFCSQLFFIIFGHNVCCYDFCLQMFHKFGQKLCSQLLFTALIYIFCALLMFTFLVHNFFHNFC